MEPDEKTCPQCAETIKAQANVCRFCGHPFTPEEVATQIKAGKRRPSRKGLGCLVSFVIIVLIAVAVTKLSEPGSELASSPLGVDTQMQKLTDKVASDFVASYNIAAQSGTALDRCTQAGLAAAAFLQAKNQSDYDRWVKIRRADCKAAGAAGL